MSHPIHPWYGPCDALAEGNCAECIKVLDWLNSDLHEIRKSVKKLEPECTCEPEDPKPHHPQCGQALKLHALSILGWGPNQRTYRERLEDAVERGRALADAVKEKRPMHILSGRAERFFETLELLKE